ncbi:MAG: LPS export ABC transporter permease LptF [Xanthomonadales bacterium]|nr:LPS export ABC transporter permease LptF [Xanthomonadales bacterium]
MLNKYQPLPTRIHSVPRKLPNPMRVLDRYLLRELLTTLLAVTLVLALLSLGGIVADMLGEVARGKFPAGLLMSQLGLRSVRFLPILLPLALFLAVLLAVGRLYRDSEMAVLAAAGVGPQRLLGAIALLVLPIVVLVAMASLWWTPSALSRSKDMIDAANRSLLVAGLEPGRFVEIPGRASVVYLAEMSSDGSRFKRLFVHSKKDGRVDVVTARSGELFRESQGEERYLSLQDGFRVEGRPGQSNFRIMRFERNDIRVPDSEPNDSGTDQERLPTVALLDSSQPADSAELHWRLAAPLATLLLALLALSLARSPPRSSRHGGLLLALVAYIVYFNLLGLGRAWLADGSVPAWLGLWWVHAPVFVAGVWLLWRAQKLPQPRATLREPRA